MEEDVGFHGREEGEAGGAGGFVEEIYAGDFLVGGVGEGVADDEFDEVEVAEDVLERAHVGVGDLAAGGDVAEGWQVL